MSGQTCFTKVFGARDNAHPVSNASGNPGFQYSKVQKFQIWTLHEHHTPHTSTHLLQIIVPEVALLQSAVCPLTNDGDHHGDLFSDYLVYQRS